MALIDRLTNIADAIRNKNGSTSKLTLDAMVTAINDIKTGVKVLIDDVEQSEDLSFKFSSRTYTYTTTSVSTPCTWVDAVVYNNEIHGLGNTQGSGNNAKYHYKWNGSSWTSVSTLPVEFRGSAVVYNNEIHILSSNTDATGKYHYKWDGSGWTSVSELPYVIHSSGRAVVYNGEIHILGGYGSKTGHYKWNGTSWSSVSTLPYDFYVSSAVVYNDELHILGSYYGAYSKMHYKWDGSSWTSVSELPYQYCGKFAAVFKGLIHILGSGNGNDYKYPYKCDKYAVWNGQAWESLSLSNPNQGGGVVIPHNNVIRMYGFRSTLSDDYMVYKLLYDRL